MRSWDARTETKEGITTEKKTKNIELRVKVWRKEINITKRNGLKQRNRRKGKKGTIMQGNVKEME